MAIMMVMLLRHMLPTPFQNIQWMNRIYALELVRRALFSGTIYGNAAACAV